MHRIKCLLIAFIVFAGSAGAQEQITGESKRCLGITRIKQMTILDNQHVVFEVAGGKHYLNTLPYPCSNLHRSRAIMYRTSIGKLCDLDIITVLDDVGPGFRPMGSCGLGRFQPFTGEEIEKLKAEIKAAREQRME